MKKSAKTSNKKHEAPQPSIEHSTGYSPRGLKKQNKFLQTTSIPDKQKLVEQNVRLKKQIFQLSQQLNIIMSEQNKKRNSIKQSYQDEALKEKAMQLKRQQLEVLNLRNKINIVKRQLESVFSNRVLLLVKQDQMKKLKQELEKLQQQKKNLIKLKDNQAKVLKIIKTEEAYQERIDQLKQEFQQLKQQAKSLHETQIESQRALRKNHQNYIIKQTKLKQLQQKLDEFKINTKTSKVKSTQQVTNQMLNQLKQEVANLEKQRKNNEKQWEDKINRIESQIENKKQQEQKKLTILKYKQRQLRLLELKIKQIEKEKNRSKKSISQGFKIAPLDPDMRQFRHKRNIKYME